MSHYETFSGRQYIPEHPGEFISTVTASLPQLSLVINVPGGNGGRHLNHIRYLNSIQDA
jgi:hypothetical protein